MTALFHIAYISKVNYCCRKHPRSLRHSSEALINSRNMKSRSVIMIAAITLLLGLCLLSACGASGAGQSFSLPPPLQIASGPLPSGTTNNAYAGAAGFPLAASGGVAPYKWSWSAAGSSSLPPGLSLAQATISGTPTAPGLYDVIVTVADSESPAAQKSTTYPVSIDMPLEITSGAPSDGTVGVGYGVASAQYFSCTWSPVLGWHWACQPCDPSVGSCPSIRCTTSTYNPKPCLITKQVFRGFILTAAGGVSPYTWSATGMPPGLDLDRNSGNISGTPTTAGSYSVSVTVSDSESLPAQVSLYYTIDIDSSSSQ